MYKTYRFRLYPTKSQEILFSKTFGCCRFIYNHFLDKCKKNGFMKVYDMCKEIKELMESYPWLKEVDSCSLRCAVFNLEDSYKNFFSKRSGYPKFKNKYSRQSYRTTCIRSVYKGKEYQNISLDLKRKIVKLPKLGEVEIRGYRNLEKINGKIINATISKETTEKYYVSIVVEEVEVIKKKVNPQNIVGIDLGIKDLVITSDGVKYSNPREIEKHEKRLKRYQRQMSRQEKGSHNYQKTKRKLARIHNRIKNSRRNHIIGIVNDIVKDNDIIVSEKLNVQGMTQNHHLSKAVLDASFSKICECLKWKTKKEGKYYYQVDTYYPSSKLCNHCGNKTNITNDLNIRSWECESCGNLNDRDINASINIMFEGLRLHYQN